MLEVKLEHDVVFVSYDVVSVFSKMSITEVCEIIRLWSLHDKTIKKHTKLQMDDIISKVIPYIEGVSSERTYKVLKKHQVAMAMCPPITLS